MFLCRRLLAPLHSPKLVSRQLAIAHRNPSDSSNAAVVTSQISRINVRTSGSTHRPDVSSPTASVSSQGLLSRLYKPATSILLADRDGETDEKTGLPDWEVYEELRYRDRGLVAALPTSVYLRVVNQAFETKSLNLADRIVLDILEVYRGGDSERNNMLRTIILTQDFTLLLGDTVVSMIQRLQQSPGGLDFLTSKAVERLVRLGADNSCTGATQHALLILVAPKLLAHLQCHAVPYGAFSLTYHPPAIIHVSFWFVHKLLTHSYEQLALDLFRVLVDTGQIPPEAMQGVDRSSKNFKLIISSALIRSGLHWNWRALAAKILVDLLGSSSSLGQSVVDLNIDTVYALLDTPTSKDVRASRLLIRQIHNRAPVPDGLIRLFYNCAAELLLGDEAEALYAFTRSPSVVKKHQYPPPQGAALPWLMLHLTSKSRRVHLSRQLASEVVDSNLPIPLHSRARFLSLTAAKGYGTLARRLWERYATGKERHIVIGNSALMIRMVSLFAYVSRRTEGLVQSRKSGDPNIEFADGKTIRQRAEDLATFLDRILSEYRAYHEPLVNAPHQVLTSFARACFIVGQFAEGFDTFRILLDRKEVPDLYDVNVALTAMAEQKPRSAARMIERMIEKGLHPDAVTFGTVMHHALLHNDTALVSDMIKRARGLQNARFSLKSVAALIRASVMLDDYDFKTTQRSKLEGAMNIIKSLTDANFVSSPQTGKYLVFTSLRADDPVMAYRFWKLLLKGSTEWNDREQRFQRRLIAQMIRKHHKRRWLDDDQTRVMLSQLRQGSGLT